MISAVDTCIVLWGWYGEKLMCPSGYIATGACSSGGKSDCGYKVYTRLTCCKVTISSQQQHCSKVDTFVFGTDMVCPKIDNRFKLVTEYCGSGIGQDCLGMYV